MVTEYHDRTKLVAVKKKLGFIFFLKIKNRDWKCKNGIVYVLISEYCFYFLETFNQNSAKSNLLNKFQKVPFSDISKKQKKSKIIQKDEEEKLRDKWPALKLLNIILNF